MDEKITALNPEILEFARSLDRLFGGGPDAHDIIEDLIAGHRPYGNILIFESGSDFIELIAIPILYNRQ